MKVRTLLVIAVTMGLSGTAFATTPPAIDTIERELLPSQYLEGQLQTRSIAEAMLRDNIPGLSMTFIDNGEIAWQKSYGYADLGTLAPVTSQTVFTGASLSKPLAAVTALQLVERGQASLDQDVNDHLVSWKLPARGLTQTSKVTLRQLIGHRAGIGNYVSQSYGVDEDLPSLTQILEGKPPSKDPGVVQAAAPGEQYRYSNPGYLIIQQLIEDTSGTSFEAAVQSGIFDVIDMRDSSFVQPIPARLERRRATGHDDGLAPYPYLLFPFQAAGGVWTTPTDMAGFAMALIEDYHAGEGGLLSREMAQAVFARDPVKLGFTKHYVEGSDDIVFDHWGSNVGFTSYMVGSLEKKQALVIMTNSDNGFDLMAAIARTVARHHGWKPIEPKVFKRHVIEPRLLEAFAGEFGSAPESDDKLAFAVIDGQLHQVGNADEGNRPLVAVGERKFIDPVQNTTYEFLANRAGDVAWVRFTLASGYNSDLPRLESLSGFIEKRLGSSGVEGLAVALIRDGKVVFDQGFGVTRSGSGGQVGSATLFEAASLSKPVFSYLVLDQVGNGALDLDQPLYTILPHPELLDDPRHELITARMVLTHTSGLPNWPADNGGKLSLLFDPGTRFQYSGAGFEYLRAVLQKKLGLDDEGLQALVDEKIGRGFGAGFLKYTWDDSIPDRKAFGHRDGVPTDNHLHDHNFGASYSLTTTAGDYARFIAGILRPDTPAKAGISGQLLERQTALPRKEGELPRTLGFAVKETSGRLMYYHSGNNGDFRAYVHFFRDTGDGIVLLSNSDRLFSSDLAKDIVEFLGDEWVHVP